MLSLPHGGGVFNRLASRIANFSTNLVSSLHFTFIHTTLGRNITAFISKRAFLRTQHRLGLTDSHKKWHAYTTGVAIFSSAFLITFIVSSLIIPVHNSNADTNSSSNASADGYSLSLSATSNVDLNLTVTHVDTMTVALGNINVQTTSPGYKLYIGMTGNSTSLNASGNNNTIPATTGSLIAPTSLTRGSWGYAIPSNTTHLVSSGFNSEYTTISSNVPDTSKRFAVPPTSNANQQLLAVSSTATTGSGDDYPIYYGIRANTDTPAGTYTNNVLFTALADAGASNTLTLTPNNIAANVATRIEVKTTMYSTATDATADVYFLTRAQYNTIDSTHSVESLGVSPLTCTKTSSTPLTYSCLVPKSTSGDYNIYVKSAKYDQVYANTFTVNALASFFTISNMQDMTFEVCSSVPTPPADATADEVPTTILADSRDTNSYTVKKLADGRCWMTENLRLTDYTLTPADSDVTSNFTLSASDSGVWCNSNTPGCVNQSKVLLSDNDDYGAYYNWYSATAGTGNYDSETDDIAESSICPKGWHLPSGERYGEYQTLISSGYNSAALMLGTPNFKQAGIRDYNVVFNEGKGYYWDSLAGAGQNSQVANYLGIYETETSVVDRATVRRFGLSVRCVANQPEFYTVQTMQQMTASVCDSVPAPSVSATNVPTTVLRDTRDTNSYTVKKLADSRCWMTDNMKLADASIDSTNSNLPPGATFDVPASSEEGWCSDATEACFNKANVLDAGNIQHQEYGMYYSWNAATAGYGLYSQIPIFEDVPYSICPKGWRLPSSKSSGDFQTLRNAYSSSVFGDDWRISPLNFPLSGYRGTSSIASQGVEGSYWSSTASNNAGAFGVRVGSSTVDMNTESGYYIYRGFSVRCIADDFWSITDMQQMTKGMAETLETPLASATNEVATRSAYNSAADKTAVVPTRTLTDTRDGKTYQVKKLADGNIWMTQNLALAGPFYPDKSDSDVTWTKVTEGANQTFQVPAPDSGTWCSDQTATCIDQPKMDLSGDGSFGYYNFFTATAGDGSTAYTRTEIQKSICPKGWRLPMGWESSSNTNSGEFEVLNTYYVTQSDLKGVPNLTPTGRRINDTIQSPTTSGFWWSSGSVSAFTARNLYYDVSGIYPADSPSKYFGNAIRCLAK